MKFLDLLIMSVNNLRRRKLRTALTVLGVVIGTASIVVMVSLGIGLNELTMERMQSYGSMTAIEIYNYNYGDNQEEPKHITDETLKEFEKLPHVKYVTPMLNFYVMMRQGAYSANINLYGVTQEYLKEIPIGKGSLPEPNANELKLVFGNTVWMNFRNTKTRENYWETGEKPDVDLYGKPVFVIFDTNAYYQSQGPQDPENPTAPPKKYMIEASGMVEGAEEESGPYSYNVYADIDTLKAQLKKVFKKNPIPGQPTNKKGKPFNYFIYENVIVYADNMDNVAELQKSLTDMGYEAYSNMEWLQQNIDQSKMVQTVLGGIGAVSLFVAAIGIANTMMMSIYERTKEIGVIKVLGCHMGTIRNMFLLEAGFIGFLGGLIGLILSYTISYVINNMVGVSETMGFVGDISRIPPWLSGAAVVFAIFIGMLAGLFPAFRAMKLSPLAAIRND